MNVPALELEVSPAASFAACMNGSKCPTDFFITLADLITCGKKHFPGTKQIPDYVHAIHERSFNDLKAGCKRTRRSALFGIGDAKLIDTMHESILETFTDFFVSPSLSVIFLFRGTAGSLAFAAEVARSRFRV